MKQTPMRLYWKVTSWYLSTDYFPAPLYICIQDEWISSPLQISHLYKIQFFNVSIHLHIQIHLDSKFLCFITFFQIHSQSTRLWISRYFVFQMSSSHLLSIIFEVHPIWFYVFQSDQYNIIFEEACIHL